MIKPPKGLSVVSVKSNVRLRRTLRCETILPYRADSIRDWRVLSEIWGYFHGQRLTSTQRPEQTGTVALDVRLEIPNNRT